MAPNSRMAGDPRFQQRWEFRRVNDLDSSSNDSGSEEESALEKHKLVSALVRVNNDDNETSRTTRSQQKGKRTTGTSTRIKRKNVGKVQRGRTQKDSLADGNTEKGLPKKGGRKKGKTSAACQNSALNDLSKYMNSMLEDLKVTRGSLLLWMKEEMQKLMAEETACESEGRESCFNLENVQHQNNFDMNAQIQCQNSFDMNTQVHYQNNYGKNMQDQQQNHFKDICQVHDAGKFEESVNLQQYLIDLVQNCEVLQHQKKFQEDMHLHRSCLRAQNSDVGSSVRFYKSNKSVDSQDSSLALQAHVDYSQAIVPYTPTKNDTEERLTLSAKSSSTSNALCQNVQVQQQRKSIVLGLQAQNCRRARSARTRRGKRSVNASRNLTEVPEYQVDYSQAIVQPKFSPDFFDQAASSMYLPLPAVLTNHHVADNRLGTSTFSSIQQRSSGNQAGGNPERPSLMLGPSSQQVYSQDMQPEERGRNIPLMSSTDITYFNRNSNMASIVGSGFPVPLHQSLNSSFSIPSQNLTRESGNILSLRTNREATRLLGGSHALPEHCLANYFHGPSTYKADGRLLTFQDSCQLPK